MFVFVVRITKILPDRTFGKLSGFWQPAPAASGIANTLSSKHLRQSISFAYHWKGERAKNGSGNPVMVSVAESLVKQGLARDVSLLIHHYPKNFLPLQLLHKAVPFLSAARKSPTEMRDRFPAPVLLRTARRRSAAIPDCPQVRSAFSQRPRSFTKPIPPK